MDKKYILTIGDKLTVLNTAALFEQAIYYISQDACESLFRGYAWRVDFPDGYIWRVR